MTAKNCTSYSFLVADFVIHQEILDVHTRFLAEIARRAENPNFIDHWIEAKSPTDLKQLLLIGATTE